MIAGLSTLDTTMLLISVFIVITALRVPKKEAADDIAVDPNS